MKKSHLKAGHLGIALMLVFGLFLSGCKKEIYPSLQNNLFSYQGNDPVIKEVVSELKKSQYGELRSRLGQHGSINWDGPKVLLVKV